MNNYVGRLLEEDYTLSNLWVEGEVSNCKYHHTGHIYFTIKDDKASISAVMFARDVAKLNFRLEEGMKIYARVRITIYEKTGSYQAYVYDIEKQGKGTLYEEFERLKVKLEGEGLFDAMHKKHIPKYPTAVGVITSATGAAVRDIIHVAKRRNSSIPLYIYPTSVQGVNAPDEIVKAIKLADKEDKVDVIILGRGGGSIEDLWAFNEEKVAYAIYNCHIPIISAVGHEVDFTISDFVSDLRAATPSAASELAVPDARELLEIIEGYKYSLTNGFERKYQNSKAKLDALMTRPVFVKKDMLLNQKRQELDLEIEALSKAYKASLVKHQHKYNLLVDSLEKLSPIGTLKRGYSITMQEGKVIKSTDDVQIGDDVEIVVADGTLKATINSKEK